MGILSRAILQQQVKMALKMIVFILILMVYTANAQQPIDERTNEVAAYGISKFDTDDDQVLSEDEMRALIEWVIENFIQKVIDFPMFPMFMEKMLMVNFDEDNSDSINHSE